MDILYEQCRRDDRPRAHRPHSAARPRCRAASAPPTISRAARPPTVESPVDGQSPGSGRRSFLIDKTNALREELREAHRHSEGKRGWLTKFVRRKYPLYDVESGAFRLEYRRCSSLFRNDTKKAGEVGPTSSSYKSQPKDAVPPAKRRRRGRPGRPTMCQELREELFQWFVDTIDNVKGRIDSRIVLMQAEILAQDLQAVKAKRVQAGETSDEEIKIPQLHYIWLLRWRRQYGLTWRMVTLRFKCSRAKLKRRLELFWRNILSVRWLHFYLNGKRQTLRFINADEKPLWFTSNADAKTLAPKGAKVVVVTESIPMTRSRFTAMTRCVWPSMPDDGKTIAVLFKGAGGPIMRDELEHCTPVGCKVQFAPKGSYREEQKNDYIKWILSEGGFIVRILFCWVELAFADLPVSSWHLLTFLYNRW